MKQHTSILKIQPIIKQYILSSATHDVLPQPYSPSDRTLQLVSLIHRARIKASANANSKPLNAKWY